MMDISDIFGSSLANVCMYCLYIVGHRVSMAVIVPK